MAKEDDGQQLGIAPNGVPSDKKHVDVWVCEGRMCTAKGAGTLAEYARAHAASRNGVRVLRGGCYGQCDLSPNVVVREHPKNEAPDVDVNRLSRTFAPNEHVYAQVGREGLVQILDAHLDGAPRPTELTLRAREETVAPVNDVAARIRSLRLKKREAREGAASSQVDDG